MDDERRQAGSSLIAHRSLPTGAADGLDQRVGGDGARRRGDDQSGGTARQCIVASPDRDAQQAAAAEDPDHRQVLRRGGFAQQSAARWRRRRSRTGPCLSSVRGCADEARITRIARISGILGVVGWQAHLLPLTDRGSRHASKAFCVGAVHLGNRPELPGVESQLQLVLEPGLVELDVVAQVRQQRLAPAGRGRREELRLFCDSMSPPSPPRSAPAVLDARPGPF